MELTKEILRNSKWVVTSEQSKRLQETAFGFGFGWYGNVKEIMFLDEEVLYFYAKGMSFSSIDMIDYSHYRCIERKFEDYFETPILEVESKGLLADIAIKLKPIDGTFIWAVEQMKQGKKVRRKSFPDNSRYMFMEDMHSSIVTDSKYTSYDIELDVVLYSTDWEVYKESRFGPYVVTDGRINFRNGGNVICEGSQLDNLEKAIKCARELQ
jgi:hypothetical protein